MPSTPAPAPPVSSSPCPAHPPPLPQSPRVHAQHTRPRSPSLLESMPSTPAPAPPVSSSPCPAHPPPLPQSPRVHAQHTRPRSPSLLESMPSTPAPAPPVSSSPCPAHPPPLPQSPRVHAQHTRPRSPSLLESMPSTPRPRSPSLLESMPSTPAPAPPVSSSPCPAHPPSLPQSPRVHAQHTRPRSSRSSLSSGIKSGATSPPRHLILVSVATFPRHSGSTQVAGLSDAQLTPVLFHGTPPSSSALLACFFKPLARLFPLGCVGYGRDSVWHLRPVTPYQRHFMTSSNTSVLSFGGPTVNRM
ncbi:uncharacterized protein LOC134773930 [Penaeus indicus]|uniref:uncharacterized protein LOC134773930 n=1 Tax=Penaeus indicus TaxID=29960 RepID=UPI00300CE6BB